eukprot:TRINITY_DN12255_c0_g1_i1.p1 TRINITY_DN12255_c0_g1~~TRINITY_DN12255_c0_g1_i1.p1  ORF type:complete len:294 (-),score=2.86 TRINITY_DN12255_c0_g1_i1:72-896(-)
MADNKPNKSKSPRKTPWYQTYPIYALFFSLIAIFIPYVWNEYYVFLTFVLSFVIFNLVVFPVRWLLHSSKKFRNLPKDKQDEIENRVVSILFNLSVTPTVYDIYWGTGYIIVTPIEAIWNGELWVLQLFVGWSIGYVLYDFLHLVRVYGETSAGILLHHCCEMLILTCYLYHTGLGGTYTVGGGLMMFSSALLHVQRIIYIFEAPKIIVLAVQLTLLVSWVYGRLVTFTWLMYQAYVHIPINFIHVALILAGIALILMNLYWTWKIARKMDLSF